MVSIPDRGWAKQANQQTRLLEALEDAEDIAASDLAMAEYERDGGVSAEEVFAKLAAEHKAAYGSNE
jgi:hypothetical protein